MKKILVLATIAALSVGIIGCGGKTNTANSVVEASVEEKKDANEATKATVSKEATVEETVTEPEASSQPEASQVEEPKADLEYATLFDKYVGYTVTIGYPKDAGFFVEEKNAYGDSPKLVISDGTNRVELNYYDSKNIAQKIEEAKKDEMLVKEFTANGMPGYVAMKEGKNGALGQMTLISENYPDTGKNDTLVIVVSNNNWDADACKEFFESDTVTTMLESITFEKSDAPDYPGVLSYDRLIGMNVDTAGAFEVEYDPYDTYLIKNHIYADGKELGYVSVRIDKSSELDTDVALQELLDSKPDKYSNGISSETYGSHTLNILKYGDGGEYHGYIDVDGTSVRFTVLVKSGTDTSVFYDYVGTVLSGIYIPKK
ncbi:MAG: spore coat CotO family protein [Lachnospiraceae bacterium]|nr:spore coat CotO family protein [Lachnospiraceae bacterium]